VAVLKNPFGFKRLKKVVLEEPEFGKYTAEDSMFPGMTT
jgi:hypothetical protein